jgi:hypothetical protein
MIVALQELSIHGDFRTTVEYLIKSVLDFFLVSLCVNLSTLFQFLNFILGYSRPRPLSLIPLQQAGLTPSSQLT